MTGHPAGQGAHPGLYVGGSASGIGRRLPTIVMPFPLLLAFLLLLALAPSGSRAQGAPADPTPPGVTLLPPPSLNFYGVVGLMDMPTAEMSPDAQFTTAISYFGGTSRYTMTFQALPWMSASFRYNGIQNLNLFGFSTYYDRSFDVRFRLRRETRIWPALTLGLQDFIGTGLYSAEYLVATKNIDLSGLGSLGGRLKLTAGLGWGRLGSYGSIGAPFGNKRPKFGGGTGGQLAFDQWFRGPMAPFGGIEWQPDDRWGLKLEYSSDAYDLETRRSSVFRRASPLNFGVEYQASKRTRLGAYYMYGSELGFTLQMQLNPYSPPTPMRISAPVPIQPRPDRAANPAYWDTAWAGSRAAHVQLRDLLAAQLAADGLVLESLDVSANAAELRFRNERYRSFANAIGRAARAMTRVLPSSVETFRLVPVERAMALSAVTIRRSDLEALEFAPDAAAAIEAVSGYGDAPQLAASALTGADLYPATGWSVEPYFSPAYFDPARPFRLDVGVALVGHWQPAPGWFMSGTIRQRVAGNVAGGRSSNSVLPHVRTDAVLYAQYDTTLNNLYAAYQWRPGRDLYGRVTVGYLEQMFGGISAELLWKPVTSRLGLGVEANWVKQRDYDQRLGFQAYSVATGHASLYYDFGNGFLGQIDAGRYLAGDVGATFSLDRTFDNGWSVGGFFTQTNVSARDFGEGSFDKGIRFTIPLNWFLGKPSRQAFGTTIRPIQRDGGARLIVPGRLYGQVREAHRRALQAQKARFWE